MSALEAGWLAVLRVRVFRINCAPLAKTSQFLAGIGRANQDPELLSTEHLATWLAFLFSLELPGHAYICIMSK